MTKIDAEVRTQERGQPLIYTQVALMGKDISQIQKDLTSLTSDVKLLASQRFVTQNEVDLKIAQLQREIAEEVLKAKTELESGVRPFKVLGTAVNTAIILAILAAIMQQILK